ncbi:hypothetical protein BO79DRAFT_203167 [Aspergillus costaricaensis CBS 115574]|uniref:Uncharacterized protein n=1 Tax=Aspergillus costaricaensis CBS 115574 TaxID=1448317 RepID=A0ACD1I1T6_9EURO|nr:hypothetical protein BO79DRAFT_203167 [Aspergillus costaricaensis CBS 115574]RAK84182.1 hypothetical protein BO79DRAFT_203167 [Aspergillus costaricaensis CBS 115574]
MAVQSLLDSNRYNASLMDYSSQFPEPSIWSDRAVQEACLMRYFVEELAPWFDSCDAGKHFALVMPDRAVQCPALLYAVYSAAARHLGRWQSTGTRPVAFAGRHLPNLGDGMALNYQSLCISHLMSADDTEIHNVDLLAASVILRFYEEFDAALAGVDGKTHLHGTQVFLNAQGHAALRCGGLQLAAFWVGIRQEFHKAFLEQRVAELDLSCCDGSVYRQLDSTDDPTWANRVVLHCVDVLRYCYGEEGQIRSQYEELCAYNQQWQALTPPTFDPLYCRPPNTVKGEIFPVLWYLDDCIVTGIQHWHLARLLLAVFDPTVPRLGPGRKAAIARRESEVKHHVFSLCGIAISNKTAPALVSACMGVSMCGDRMTDRREQEALFDILLKTEQIHGLTTTHAQNSLRAAWEWDTTVSQVPSFNPNI